VVHGGPEDQAIEPRLEGARVPDILRARGDLEQRLLRGVLGVVRVAEHVQADGVDAVLVGPQERQQRFRRHY